jgi:hypothetical protein
MKQMWVLAALAAFAFGAQAASHAAKEMTPQQNKMTMCNKDAGDKKLAGDERKKFMSECLSAKTDGRAAQQEKMKTCNKDAGDKKLAGDERKKFMSDCLSKKA